VLIQTISQNRLVLGSAAITALEEKPGEIVEGRVGKCRFHARVAIPNYAENVAGHYADLAPNGLASLCDDAAIALPFRDFGLVCTFDSATELQIHDADLILDEGIRELVGHFGPIVITNAYLPANDRRADQTNIFPHLQFHFDRGPNQPTQISLFYRDPFDPVQAAPRESSTVHCANMVAHLQYARETGQAPKTLEWRGFYNIFEDQDTAELLGKILMEHRWDAPQGTGEISVLFNGTILHASYYRRTALKGYPISVRYLG